MGLKRKIKSLTHFTGSGKRYKTANVGKNRGENYNRAILAGSFLNLLRKLLLKFRACQVMCPFFSFMPAVLLCIQFVFIGAHKFDNLCFFFAFADFTFPFPLHFHTFNKLNSSFFPHKKYPKTQRQQTWDVTSAHFPTAPTQ